MEGDTLRVMLFFWQGESGNYVAPGHRYLIVVKLGLKFFMPE